jgi:hypothetical protein
LNISPFPLHQRGFSVALIGFVFSTSSTVHPGFPFTKPVKCNREAREGREAGREEEAEPKDSLRGCLRVLCDLRGRRCFMPDAIETPPHKSSNRRQIALRRSAAIVHFRAFPCIRRSRLRETTGVERPATREAASGVVAHRAGWGL